MRRSISALSLLILLSTFTANAQTPEKSSSYLTKGGFAGIGLAGAPSISFMATPREQNLRPYEVQTGFGIQAYMYAGYGLIPWLTPFLAMTYGQSSEKKGDPTATNYQVEGFSRRAHHIYGEIGSRLNLAIPKSPVVPYLSASWGYRILSSQLEKSSGNVTYYYEGTDRSYKGTVTTIGGGVLIKSVDFFYLVSTGTPNNKDDESYGTMKTTRMGVALTIYKDR